MTLFLGILLLSVRLCSQSSISCANGDRRSQIEIGNLYNLCYQAQGEHCSKGASFTSRIYLCGQGSRNYNVQLRLVGVSGGGRINPLPPPPPPPPPLPKKKSSTVLSEPKFGPPKSKIPVSAPVETVCRFGLYLASGSRVEVSLISTKSLGSVKALNLFMFYAPVRGYT